MNGSFCQQSKSSTSEKAFSCSYLRSFSDTAFPTIVVLYKYRCSPLHVLQHGVLCMDHMRNSHTRDADEPDEESGLLGSFRAFVQVPDKPNTRLADTREL